MAKISVGILLILFQFAEGANRPIGKCKLDDRYFNTEEGGCWEYYTGKVWSLSPAEYRANYATANQYCLDLDESGYQDWRLPDEEELTLVSLDNRAKKHFRFDIQSFFWAFDGSKSKDAMVVSLLERDSSPKDRVEYTNGSVVCVRDPADTDGDHIPNSSDKCNLSPKGLTVWTRGKFKGCAGTKEGDELTSSEEAQALTRDSLLASCKKNSEHFRTEMGGCRDQKPGGLVWSAASDEPMTWSQANRHCENLIHGFLKERYSDWRLPKEGELVAVSGVSLAMAHLRLESAAQIWADRMIRDNVKAVSGSLFSVIERHHVNPSVLLVTGGIHDEAIQYEELWNHPNWSAPREMRRGSGYTNSGSDTHSVLCVRELAQAQGG